MQSPTIANQNLSLLNSFMKWATDQDFTEDNPFQGIKPAKGNQNRSQNRTPFSLDEITRILDTVAIDPGTCHYHDFILALLSLGARPSELIGLRWQDIDWARQLVRIAHSLSRAGDGRSSSHARERKAAKTGTVRDVPIPDRLFTILQQRKSGETDPADLVFTSPSGKAIDDHSFSQRTWRRVLQRAGVPHRPPYTCRHTCISLLLEQGATMQQAAHIAGHKDSRMIASVYGHMMNLPKMPNL